MRPYRPMTLLILGSLVVGILFAVGSAVLDHSTPTTGDFTSDFGAGKAVGFLCIAPIALAEQYRTQLLRILEPWWFHLQFYVSCTMGMALGYLIACVRHKVGDEVAIAAFTVVFVCALTKTMMAVVGRPSAEGA